jgi:hypothetical protein
MILSIEQDDFSLFWRKDLTERLGAFYATETPAYNYDSRLLHFRLARLNIAQYADFPLITCT